MEDYLEYTPDPPRVSLPLLVINLGHGQVQPGIQETCSTVKNQELVECELCNFFAVYLINNV